MRELNLHVVVKRISSVNLATRDLGQRIYLEPLQAMALAVAQSEDSVAEKIPAPLVPQLEKPNSRVQGFCRISVEIVFFHLFLVFFQKGGWFPPQNSFVETEVELSEEVPDPLFEPEPLVAPVIVEIGSSQSRATPRQVATLCNKAKPKWLRCLSLISV